MAPAVDKASYELHVLRAAADGVEPALLLQAPGRKAEYLFNVPDGFSRLALEHKLIPSARLSCVLLTSLLPTSTGGLGGLILRLKHDGHGQLQIIGPRGSSCIAHSLRHICRWQHPKVFVSECCDNGPLPVFEDEHIVIVPILAGDQSTGCPWCLYASPETSKSNDPSNEILLTTFEQHDNSSSSSDCSGSSTSSSDHSSRTRLLQSALARCEGDSFERRLSMFNAYGQEDKDVQSKELDATGNGGAANSGPHDRGHTEEGCDWKGYQSILPQRRKRGEDANQHRVLDEETFFGHVKDELDKVRTNKPVHYSSSGSSAPSNDQHICNTPVYCNDLSHSMGIGQSSLLGLTPDVNPQGDIKERDALQDTAAEGNPRSLACDVYSRETGFQGCFELQYPPCSTPLVNCSNSQKCDVASGVEEPPETSKDINLMLATRDNWSADKGLPVMAIVAEPINVHSMTPYYWRISNLQQNLLPQLADESNPVYGSTSSGLVGVVSSVGIVKDLNLKNAGGCDSHQRQPARVLGFICYLRKLNTAVLVVDCRGVKCLESLRRHPALSCIYHTSEGLKDNEAHTTGKAHVLSSVVHLTPHSLVQSSDYQMWMHSLSSTFHTVMNERCPEFGFQSSLTTLKRLNNIHPDIFPLPPNISSSPRKRQAMRNLAKSNMTVVDAELSMVLRFSDEGTTLSYKCVDYSESTSVKHSSSLAETSEPTHERMLSKVEVQKSDSNATSHLTANALAAAGIKRRLLERKEALLSIGTPMQSRRTVSCDSMIAMQAMKNCSRQDGACKSSSLPATTSGHPDSSQLCPSGDEIDEDGDRPCNVHRSPAVQVVLNGEQQRTTLLEVSKNDDIIPATRGLISEQEYLKLHDVASEFQLIFLGTGCAEPSKKRGSSGILLQVRGAQGAMLLDAGEGATGQLFRRFGNQGGRTIISSLQCLWVSHKHGDHVLGILSILHTRSTDTAPLMIIGPHKVGQWLSEVRDTCAASGCPALRFTYVHCEELSDCKQYRSNQLHKKQLIEVLHAMQLQSMRSVKVFHCYDAYGIILNGRRGWKVVYSGDTRPCKQLTEAGQGCTLLIHEATFEDSLVEQAKQKRHSTVSEAVQVGWRMQARHVILTHFSQRYPEMVAINSDQNDNISLAFDGMVVSSELLDSLGKLLPLIRIACQKIENNSPNTVQRIENPSIPMPSWHRESGTVVQKKTDSCLNTGDPEQSAVAKHTRWPSDSDGEAESQCLEDHPIPESIKWSGNSSKETKVYQHGGLPMMDASRVPTYGITSAICQEEIRPFSSKEVSGISALKAVSLNNYCEVKRVLSDVSETYGPFGGKHLRWNDSDSEDA